MSGFGDYDDRLTAEEEARKARERAEKSFKRLRSGGCGSAIAITMVVLATSARVVLRSALAS